MPNISLTEPLEHYVDSQIKAGRFANLSEAMRAGIWSLMKEDERAARLRALRSEFEEAVAQADRGEARPFSMEEFEPRLKSGFHET